MRRAAIVAVIAVTSAACPLRGQAAFEIPHEKDGYTITKSGETDVPAPAGYEGRTNTATQTAVSSMPATKGMSFVNHFTIKNEIKTCPAADGRAEGDGLLQVSFDFKNMQAAGTSSIHIEMSAKAKYKGKVDDDAQIGLVDADIDYTYSLTTSGPWQGPGAQPAPVQITHHVTTKFGVIKGAGVPDIKPFEGGDPTNGKLEQAYAAGQAIVFWAGFYYSVAETKWLQDNQCVEIAFTPPSESRQPVLGSEVKVNAEIKTRAGEGVRGKFRDVLANTGGGSVSITSSATDPGSPAIFQYTAPNQKVNNAGFSVNATSRAGVARGYWKTGLGTGWSGEITMSRVYEGDAGQNELQLWSNSEKTRVTITVKNGVGTAYAYYEGRNIAISKQKAMRGGAITLIDGESSDSERSAEGGGPATLGVDLAQDGTYSLTATFAPPTSGKTHYTTCVRDNCTSVDKSFIFAPFLPAIAGKVDEPNHLHGSQNSTVSNMGYSKKGTTTSTLSWDLWRQGTTK